MGLLDSVLGGVMGGALGQGQGQAQGAGANAGLLAALLPVALSMINGQSSGGGLGSMLGNVLGGGQGAGALGGLGGLIGAFQKAGLGEHAASWVGTGENMPISADDVTKVLGHDTVAQVAQQAGVSHGDASAGLAALLPQLINHLTPNGQMPSGDQLQASLGDLLKNIGRG
ncbi:MAG TPA: YidB family protein [Rhodocyclaceae bacterium]|nr:YidB family protein [Rhodocyclaceae bacterium]